MGMERRLDYFSPLPWTSAGRSRIHPWEICRQTIVVQQCCNKCITGTVEKPLDIILELCKGRYTTFEVWAVLYALGDQQSWANIQAEWQELRCEEILDEPF